MSADILSRAAGLRAEGTPFVLATVVASYPPQSVRPGAKAIVFADGAVEGWVGGGCVRPVVVQEASAALADGKPRLVRMNAGAEREDAPGVRVFPMTCQGEGGVEIYLEPVQPAPRLVVLGHTPVARSLARLAPEIGFDVVVSSSGTPVGGWPGDARIVSEAADAVAGASTTTAVVVATMGAGDEDALAAAASSGAEYVGLVASRKKARFLFEFLRASGVSAEALARVKAPAGLDLGGMTPGEIALSILAEIVQRAASGERRAAAPQVETSLPIDPICGMTVDPTTAKYTLVQGDRTIYFCCPHCKAAYAKTANPSR